MLFQYFGSCFISKALLQFDLGSARRGSSVSQLDFYTLCVGEGGHTEMWKHNV